MTRESHLEMKVGVIVLTAMLTLTFFVVSISDISLFEKRHFYNVVFGYANGLRDAAPVRLAGVEAGLVKKMDVFVDDQDQHKTKVKVTFFVKEGTQIPKDSTFTINQLGLLGEKYIEIIPGVSGEFVTEGATLMGKDPLPIEKITEQVSSITGKLDTALDGLNSIISDVNQGKGTIGKFIKDDTLYMNLEELSEDLKSNPWKLFYKPKLK